VLVSSTVSAWGGLEYVNQNRGLTAATYTGGEDQDQAIFAPDYGAFDASLEVVGNDPSDFETGYARAEQHSLLLPMELRVSQQAVYGSLGAAWAHFEVSFLLSETMTYRLTYTPTGGSIKLSEGVSSGIAEGLPDGTPLDGTLQPGMYTLKVNLMAVTDGIGGGTGSQQVEAALKFAEIPSIPTPAASSLFLATAGSIGVVWAVRKRRAA